MSGEHQYNPTAERLFGFAIIGLFALIGWQHFKSRFLTFYLEHRIWIALGLTVLILWIFGKGKKFLSAKFASRLIEDEILGPSTTEDSLFAGFSNTGKRVFIKPSFRRMHTQVIGTTNAGKTESVILPWAIDDIKKHRGLLIIDGKSDRSLLDKLYGYAKLHGREQEVKILSLFDVDSSCTFNPFANGSPLELTERIFKALNFDNEYYKSLQYEALLQVLLIFKETNVVPTPLKIIEVLRSTRHLESLAKRSGNADYLAWANQFNSKSQSDRDQQTSGLVTQLQILAVGETALIFNCEKSEIDFIEALNEGHIIYCQLPVLKIPSLGKTVGKLILQCLQSAVASRHLGMTSRKDFYSVYLDDFTEYLTDSFVSLLNKSRSANVAVVFAHQALGDLAALGDGIKNTILTNSNLKVFMRTNEPESAEYFSQTIGTIQSEKKTERERADAFGSSKTGDSSVRTVEEFRFHPNLFKQDLGVGEAVMIIPHSKGSLPVRIKFRKVPDIDAAIIPKFSKPQPMGLPELEVEGLSTQIANGAAAGLAKAAAHGMAQKEAPSLAKLKNPIQLITEIQRPTKEVSK